MVHRSKAQALRCIAVTDHDTVSPELTQRVTLMSGVELITGVEVKARFGEIDGELLGYFVDPSHPRLHRLLQPLCVSRDERMRQMVDLCREFLGIDITEAEVRAVAGEGNVGRPHLARVLVDRGVVETMQQAFAELIGRGCPCYAPIVKPHLDEAVAALKAAGGVVSVAHPCLMRVKDWSAFLDQLLTAGVQALETVYLYDPASRDLTLDPRALAAEAERRGFLVTGGSDDHGPGSTRESLGSVHLPYRHVEALQRAAGL
ncbi:MAG TPA: PHP domain-containing protein [Candidatus Acetothermia bacterium]|nr:PHP domain-containing protein [Candidatus Acetothermia bacterium]